MGAVGGDQPGEPVAAGHEHQTAGSAGEQRPDLRTVARVVQQDQHPAARQQAAVQSGPGVEPLGYPRGRYTECFKESP